MILHILRKDLKLFWPMVLGVTAIQWIERIADSSRGVFIQRLTPLSMMSTYLSLIGLLAVAILIVLVVQTDAIPGLRQDWLVRPIRRRDLLLSKLLFVALLVQGPIFVAEVAQGIAAGFPLIHAIGAPLSRSVSMFLMFDLPVLAFAGLTRNLLEALGAAIAVAVAAALFLNLNMSLNPESLQETAGTTALNWVTDALQTAWGAIAAAGLLALLYFRRKTNPARWIFGAACAVWLLAVLLPWQTVFAIQQRFSAQPSAADPVRISFAPSAGNIRLEKADQWPAGIRKGLDDHAFVPVNVQGLAGGELLGADRAESRLVSSDGHIFQLGQAPQLHNFRGGAFHQALAVPHEIWNVVKDQPMQLEIDYSLTVLKPGPEHTIPAVGGNQWIPETGRCATRMNSDQFWVTDNEQQLNRDRQIEMGCLAPGYAPCEAMFIQPIRTEPAAQQHLSCRSNYAPYFGRLAGDSLSRFADFDIPGTNAPALKDAQLVVRIYQPAAHFTRQVVIPNIKLGDWTGK